MNNSKIMTGYGFRFNTSTLKNEIRDQVEDLGFMEVENEYILYMADSTDYFDFGMCITELQMSTPIPKDIIDEVKKLLDIDEDPEIYVVGYTEL